MQSFDSPGKESFKHKNDITKKYFAFKKEHSECSVAKERVRIEHIKMKLP